MSLKSKAASFISYGLLVMTVTHTLTHVLNGVHPAIFSLLRDEFSLSLRQLGLIAAIPPLCQAFFTLPSGMFSDRYGPKKMLLASLSVAVLGAVIASIANSPLIFIVAICMVYINNSIYHPASYSYTANAFTDKDRPKALGLHGAGNTLGHSTGPLAVSILIGILAFGWRQVYLILMIPILLGIVMVLFLKEKQIDQPKKIDTKQSESSTETQTFLTTSLVMFLTFRALTSMGARMISSFLVLYLQDIRGLSLALASLIFSSRQLSGLVASPLGGYMAFRFGEKRWLVLTSAIGYLSFGLSIFSKSMVWFVIFFLIYGFCNTVNSPARTSIIARLSPPKRRGLGFSLFFLPNSIIGAIAPAIAGIIAEIYGFNAIFYITMGAYALAWLIVKFMVKID